MTKSINIKEVLEDLSYSISSAEAEHIYQLISNNEHDEAREILSDYLSEIEIKALFQYYMNKAKRMYELEEVSLEILIRSLKEKLEKNEYNDNSFLINHKGNLSVSKIFISPPKKDIEVYSSIETTFIPIQNLQQVWLIKEK